jgi:hypothetical protein
MPAVIKRVTWCLAMETLLLRFPVSRVTAPKPPSAPRG